MITNKQQSEIARILQQIREEYEASYNGLSGLSQGTGRHSFITARMEHMGKLQEELEKVVPEGVVALDLTIAVMEEVADSHNPIPAALLGRPPISPEYQASSG